MLRVNKVCSESHTDSHVVLLVDDGLCRISRVTVQTYFEGVADNKVRFRSNEQVTVCAVKLRTVAGGNRLCHTDRMLYRIGRNHLHRSFCSIHSLRITMENSSANTITTSVSE